MATRRASRPKASGSARTGPARKRPTARRSGSRRNPSALATARRESRQFNGAGFGDVIRLTKKERQLPEYVVPLGRMPELDYKPERGARARWTWEHKSGDRGALRKGSKRKPMLAADPKTGRPIILPMGSPMRFSSRRGLVG